MIGSALGTDSLTSLMHYKGYMRFHPLEFGTRSTNFFGGYHELADFTRAISFEIIQNWLYIRWSQTYNLVTIEYILARLVYILKYNGNMIYGRKAKLHHLSPELLPYLTAFSRRDRFARMCTLSKPETIEQKSTWARLYMSVIFAHC